MVFPGMKTATRAAALAACIALSTGAAGQPAPKPGAKSAAKSSPKSANWNGQVSVNANGSYRLGNPEAPVRLTEYVSYTCPHCAHYQAESEPTLRLTVVPKGQVSVTVVNVLRNPVDLTVAMLTYCGDPKRYFVRNNAFFATQEKWLAKVQAASPGQQQRWFQGTTVDRMRAVANDLGFYPMLAGWGTDRAQADACLSDQAMLDKLKAQQADVESAGVAGTPSFTINGQLLEAHDWASVSQAITEKLAQLREGNI